MTRPSLRNGFNGYFVLSPVTGSFATVVEMKRAIRKNSRGESVDTICGHVKGKKATGEDTGDSPFLYLVKDDDAYIVTGRTADLKAMTAYRSICN